MKFAASIVIALLAASCDAFVPSHVRQPTSFVSTSPITSLAAEKASRFDGNRRNPNEQDIAIMDEMISKMAEAKPYDLPNAVKRAFRVCSSPRFFIRIAERADMATEDSEKDKFAALATNLAATLEAVVSTTEDQLDDRAKELEGVVKAAAEPESGEFLVPLTTDRIESMRASLKKIEPSRLDETFLTTVDSWIAKSHQDGMDGMVGILQKLLQQYAGMQVSRARAVLKETKDTPSSNLFEHLLVADADLWDVEIRKGINEEVTSSALVGEIQRTMESVILGLENGSMAQRIQAEYLKELVTRVEALQESAN
jgi:hypothetical protein